MDNPVTTPDGTEQVWAYPEDGGDPRVITIAVGGDAPQGYSFKPVPARPSDDQAPAFTAAETRLAQRLKVVADDRAQIIEAANERIEALEAEQAASDKDFEAQTQELQAAERNASALQKKLAEANKALAAAKKAAK